MRGQVVHLEEPRMGAGPRGRVDHAHYLRALEMQVDTGLSFNAIPKALKGSFAVMAPGQQLEVSIPCARSYGRASQDIALTVTEGQAREARGTGYCALAWDGKARRGQELLVLKC
ncbi:hypothetical protein HaLaN_13285, partial [Haematococcus lacustris]